MENGDVSRLINSFNAIKGYFDTTRKYMPQIAKLVVFIEEIIPLLDTIRSDIHQSTDLIPKAAEKLGKVTSATEMATTEVMDIVDAVIERLNRMTASVDAIERLLPEELKVSSTEHMGNIRTEIAGSQDDLFSIMNALQFQDITTQQINAIGETIDTVQMKLNDLLRGFQQEGIALRAVKKAAFDPNAEFNFERSAASQELADQLLHGTVDHPTVDAEKKSVDEDIIIGPDGQPDIASIMKEMKKNK
jgi:chemotaxis regulatin CheY-phosphate phosphatase CheZ